MCKPYLAKALAPTYLLEFQFHLNSKCDRVCSCVSFIMFASCWRKSYKKLKSLFVLWRPPMLQQPWCLIMDACIWTNITMHSLVLHVWLVLVLFEWARMLFSSSIVIMLLKVHIFALLESMQLLLHLLILWTH